MERNPCPRIQWKTFNEGVGSRFGEIGYKEKELRDGEKSDSKDGVDSRDGEELVSNHARGTREKESEASRTVSLKPNGVFSTEELPVVTK